MKIKDKHKKGGCHIFTLLQEAFSPAVSLLLICCLLDASLLSGCAQKKGVHPYPSERPAIEGRSTQELLAEIWLTARKIRSMKISAKVRITEQGETGPWVSSTIWLYDSPAVSKLRMRGTGPFGMTLFDILSADGTTRVHLPRNKQKFSGRFFSLWEQKLDAEELKALIILALKPWESAEGAEPRDAWFCGNERFCIMGSFMGHAIKAGFRFEPAPAPLFIGSEQFHINYSGSLPFVTDSTALRYPKRIKMRLLDWGIRLELIVKSMEINAIGPDDPIFFSP